MMLRVPYPFSFQNTPQKTETMLTEPDAATVVVATMNNSGKEDYNKGESWVDDEFISFGGGDDDDDNDEDVDEDANHNDRGNNLAPQQPPPPPPPPPPPHAVVLPPWMDVPTDYRRVNPLIALHNEIVSFCHLMQPLPEEMKERQELIQRIQQLVYKTFGGPDKVRTTTKESERIIVKVIYITHTQQSYQRIVSFVR
jgi:hypothetical protein